MPPAASPWVPSLQPSFWALVCSAVRRPWPTIAEAGVPGYEATSWFGMFAPAGTPAPVLAKLNAAIVKVLAQPDVKKKINEQGAEVYSETPEQFSAFIQAESVKWGKVVKESGASLD